MTQRELQQHFYGVSSEVLLHTLTSMVKAEWIVEKKVGRKIWYLIFDDAAEDKTKGAEKTLDEV